MAKSKKLPDTMSGLIRVALADLIAVEEQKERFAVDMSVWHAKAGYGGQKKCIVCFAGSVMAVSLKVSDKKNAVPTNFSDENQRKLEALDHLRQGEIYAAAETLQVNKDPDGYDAIVRRRIEFNNRDVAVYEDNKTHFKRDMRKLAADLEKAGY